jgi:hypothetical protein
MVFVPEHFSYLAHQRLFALETFWEKFVIVIGFAVVFPVFFEVASAP